MIGRTHRCLCKLHNSGRAVPLRSFTILENSLARVGPKERGQAQLPDRSSPICPGYTVLAGFDSTRGLPRGLASRLCPVICSIFA